MDSIRHFAELLRDLQTEAGAPSVRRLAKLSTELGSPIAHTTIDDKLNGRSKPDREFVDLFIKLCVRHAQDEGIPLDAAAVDQAKLHAAYRRMLADVADTRREQRQARRARKELDTTGAAGRALLERLITLPSDDRSRRRADSGTVSALPSVLLHPERGIVPFEHRDAALADLSAWIGKPAPVSVRLLTGQGGEGKTRLAMRMIDVLSADEAVPWVAGHLAPDVPAAQVRESGSVDLPLFVVVDYAEGRVDEVENLLTALTATPSRQAPARVLLVSRSAGDWFRALRETADDAVAALLSADIEQQLLPIRPDALDRPAEFTRATIAFSRALGRSTAGVVMPDDLGSARYGCALDLHAAALAALLDREDTPDRPSTDPLLRVLHHERRYWRQSKAGFELDHPHTDRFDAVVAVATAFGADSETEAMAVLTASETFEGASPAVVKGYLKWAQALYPGDSALEGLRPDRLGEDHLADVLATAPGVLARPLAAASASQRRQALTVLGRTVARRSAALAPLTQLVAGDPADLLRTGIAVAARLPDPLPFVGALSWVANTLDDRDTLWALMDALSAPSTALDGFAVQVAARLRGGADSGASRDDELEVTLAVFTADKLLNLRRPDEALPLAAGAVEQLQSREAPLSAEDSLDLAGALVTLAQALHELGQLEDALDRLELAAELVAGHPDAPETAVVLTAMGRVLDDLGATPRAVDVATSALEAARRVARHDPDQLPLVGEALALRARLRWTCEQFHEAVEDHTAAEEIWRELAEEALDRHGVPLVEQRILLAGALAGVGDRERALSLSQESVATSARLVDRHGLRFLPTYAGALNSSGAVHSWANDLPAAHAAYSQAIDAYRVLADDHPERHLPLLAGSLYNRSGASAKRDRLLEAIDDDEESADILRKLADRRPAAHTPDLIRSLTSLWSNLDHLHRAEEAHAVIAEVVELAGKLPADPPPHLAAVSVVAWHGLTSSLVALERDREAVVAGTRAVRLARELHRRRRDWSMPIVSAELPNLGDLLHLVGKALAACGRHRHAVRIFSEAVGIYRKQARVDPRSVALERANLDNDLAISLSELGRYERALSAVRRAESAYRELVAADRDAHLPALVLCLGNVSAIANDLADSATAVSTAEEVVTLAREVARDGDPGMQGVLGTALVNYSCVVGSSDLDATARSLAEAFELAEDLDDGELRDWVVSELGDYPLEDIRIAWEAHSAAPFPMP